MGNRGLGRPHRTARSLLPPPDGAPCPFCGRPMWPWQALDADHPTPRVLGGSNELRWAHSPCNRSDGARLGNALRGRIRTAWVDRWA